MLGTKECEGTQEDSQGDEAGWRHSFLLINSRDIKHSPCMISLYIRESLYKELVPALYDLVDYYKNKLVKISQQDE